MVAGGPSAVQAESAKSAAHRRFNVMLVPFEAFRPSSLCPVVRQPIARRRGDSAVGLDGRVHWPGGTLKASAARSSSNSA